MTISYQNVPKSSRLLQDYLYDSDRVSGFFSGSPFHIASYRAMAEKLGGSHNHRSELARILTRQNQAFGSPQEVFANIDRLKDEKVFAVVTGQQVGLFSGPAFTIYKALTAVRVAQWLSSEGLPCVPMFWLATEDHDFDEVSQTAVLDEQYELVTLTEPGERPSSKAPVGIAKLSAGVNELLNKFEAALPAGEPREQVLRDLRDAYQPGAAWGQAFAKLMVRLFGKWGVVLVDSLDAELHRLSERAYRLAVEKAGSLRQRLLERNQALVRCGYHAQVHVADDSTLLFALENGERLPVRSAGNDFVLGDDARVSAADLAERASQHPEHFSANALMRPIVQDTLLPTLAYVAGPSELAYLGQSQAIYQEFGRPMPVVFPRAAFTLVDRKAQRLLEKYEVSVEDVWRGEEHLNQKLAGASAADGWADRFDQSEREVAALLARLAADIQTIDPTLLDTLKHAGEKMKYQLEKLRGKLSRSALQRSDSLTRHRHLLQQLIFPAKEPQERQICGLCFLARAGYGLLDQILSEIRVDSSEHQVLQY